MQNTEFQLKKDIGFVVALSIVIGSVIGSGIFMKPGKVIAAAGSSDMALWAWVIGGIITLASGLTIAEVCNQIPKTGGLYVYIEEVYGSTMGYLTGWVQTFIYGPGVIGALGLYFGSLLAGFFGWPSEWKIMLGLVTIIILAIANSLGTKYGGFIQAAATAGKLVPIFLIAIFGLLMGNTGQLFGASSGLPTSTGMGAAILATLWAYDGWMLVGFVAGEMRNPAKVLPKAIVIGLAVVMIAYLSVNMALLKTLPAQEIVLFGEKAAGTAAGQLFGEFGGRLLSIGILISIFGTLNAKILTMPRVPFAMALRSQLPASNLLSKVHPSFGTPVNATVLTVLIAVFYLTIGDPDRLTDISIFAIIIFLIFAFTSVFILRKKNGQEKRTYSVPLYPVTPLVAIIGTAYIVFATLLSSPVDSLYALAITFLGLPVYWLVSKTSKHRK
ncbi:MAG: amino acid permease [Desulfitobacterium hafniense]|nr:amino acid permease [Desulfitobacterium hafniense]